VRIGDWWSGGVAERGQRTALLIESVHVGWYAGERELAEAWPG